jgi:hypothetical protein
MDMSLCGSAERYVRPSTNRKACQRAPHEVPRSPGLRPLRTYTHGLWKDTKSDLMFTLVVDDFGVQYTNKADAARLMQMHDLKQQCKVSEDWAGTRYIRLTIKWDYDLRTVGISMPG